MTFYNGGTNLGINYTTTTVASKELSSFFKTFQGIITIKRVFYVKVSHSTYTHNNDLKILNHEDFIYVNYEVNQLKTFFINPWYDIMSYIIF